MEEHRGPLHNQQQKRRSCPSCGYADDYRQRIVALLRENKSLQADIRTLQAEVILLKGLVKSGTHDHMPPPAAPLSPLSVPRPPPPPPPPRHEPPLASCTASPISSSSYLASRSVDYSVQCADSLLWEIERTLADSGGRRWRHAASSRLDSTSHSTWVRGGSPSADLHMPRRGEQDELLSEEPLNVDGGIRGETPSMFTTSPKSRTYTSPSTRMAPSQGDDDNFLSRGVLDLDNLEKALQRSTRRISEGSSKPAGGGASRSGGGKTKPVTKMGPVGRGSGKGSKHTPLGKKVATGTTVKHSITAEALARVRSPPSARSKAGGRSTSSRGGGRGTAIKTAKELEEADAQLEQVKATLFSELRRRLPTEKAIGFLDFVKGCCDSSITYEDAFNEAYRILGSGNMDLFYGFSKVCFAAYEE